MNFIIYFLIVTNLIVGGLLVKQFLDTGEKTSLIFSLISFGWVVFVILQEIKG